MHLTSLAAGSFQPLDRIPAFGLGKILSKAKEDFQSLSGSLGSGDVAGAQNTLADLKKLLQSTGSIGAANSVKSDLDSLGKNLGAHNVPSALQDLNQLQTDLQSSIQQNRGRLPGLPVRLPGAGGIYQAGLSASKTAVQTVGRLFA